MELLKFLIADDEENIRNGLKYIIDWEKCGYKFCGEASNGKDAVSQIIDLQPDLVILDIKMPGMTGIEVMNQVNSYFKQKNIQSPSVIILSGFSEFEYAKDALNKGAKAYLLKPVDEDQLEKNVIKIGEEIRKQRNLEKTSTNAAILQTKESLSNLLSDKNIFDLQKEVDANFFDDVENSCYQAIIFSLKYYNPEYIEQLTKSIYSNFSFFTKIIQKRTDSIVVILKTKNQIAVSNCLERIAKLYSNRTFITCGENYIGEKGIVTSYKQANEFIEQLFYISNANYVNEELINNSDSSINEAEKETINKYIDKIIFSIETYDKKTLDLVEKEIFDYYYKIRLPEAEAKKSIIYILLELRNKIVAKYPEREISDGETFDVVPKTLEKNTFEDMMTYFNHILSNYVENFNFNTSDSVIVKVIAYIKNNYTEDLKLETLGDMFNCNRAYLGKKFKKYTGMQFNNYLDNLRIEDAKNKILNTDLKIYQISKLVGYSNTDYFFMKFKKSTGMTPKEFKKLQGKDDEE